LSRIAVGTLAGLAAVVVTTVVNLLARRIGLFREGMDLKYMGDFLAAPHTDPSVVRRYGIVVHLVSGALLGALYGLTARTPSSVGSGLWFGGAVWALNMTVLLPLTGRGLFGTAVGWYMAPSMLSLSGLYGAMTALAARRLTGRPGPRPHTIA
jgi:hypothetical protein